MSKLGKLVEDRRKQLKMTQTDLGIVLGLGSKNGGQFVSNVARGTHKWPPNHLPAICRVLKISRSEMCAQFLADKKDEFDKLFEKKKV